MSLATPLRSVTRVTFEADLLKDAATRDRTHVGRLAPSARRPPPEPARPQRPATDRAARRVVRTTAELARETGVTTIALTQADSLVAKAADIVIPIDLAEGNNIFRPTSTRIAYLAAVDILASLVAYNIPQAAVTLRRIKQQLVAHRDGDDRQLLGD